MGRFIASLESVRGLAALTVCLFHAADVQFMGAPVLEATSAARVLLDGHGAVVLFFVLSGFVLRSSLESRIAAPSLAVAAGFVTARVFRLFPVIIVTVLVFAAVAPLARGQSAQVGDVIRNALLLDINLVGAFWTLQVEVFGSALVLAAFLIERRFGIWAVVAMTAALLPLSFLGSLAVIGGVVSSGLFYTFLCGYLVAALPRKAIRSSRQAALICCGAVIAFYAASVFGFVLTQWLLLVTTISASLIVYVLSTDRCRNLLQWGPVRLLGGLSYSFYALHGLGLDLAQSFAAPIEKLDPARWIAVVLLLAVAAGAAFLFSIPMNYFIERPGVSAGRRLVAALSSGRTEPA